MEKQSKTSLKHWLRKINSNKYRLAKLYEELDYLETKSMCYNGTTYGNDLILQSDPYHNKLTYWLDRIEKVTKEIKSIEAEQAKLEAFKARLSPQELVVLERYYLNGESATLLAIEMKISRGRLYEIVSSAERKWLTH